MVANICLLWSAAVWKTSTMFTAWAVYEPSVRTAALEPDHPIEAAF
jgi:hypothetical protein